MAQPPAPVFPAHLHPALLDAPSLPTAPSASAAACAQPRRHKQSAPPALQESARTRRAQWGYPSRLRHIPEIHPGSAPGLLQTFPPASNASALDPLATASFHDPQAVKSPRPFPIPTAYRVLSPPTSCNRRELGLPPRRSRAPALATSNSSRRPFSQPRQGAIPCRILLARHRPHQIPPPTSARKIQSTCNVSKETPGAKSNRCNQESLLAYRPGRLPDRRAGSLNHSLRESPPAHPYPRAPIRSRIHSAVPKPFPQNIPPRPAVSHPLLEILNCAALQPLPGLLKTPRQTPVQ